MTEIKPVYQVQQLGEWIEVDKSIFDELYIQNKFPHRILYPAAAYEALQKENAELKDEDEISAAVIKKCCNLLAQIAITIKGELKELTRHGYHDLPELVSVLHVENELNKHRILEQSDESAAQAKRIAELEETNGLLQTQVHCLEMVAASKNGDSK